MSPDEHLSHGTLPNLFESVDMSLFTIDIAVRYPSGFVDNEFLESAITQILVDEGIVNATISLAIVNDSEIQRLNREFLGHDFPTDVISFVLSEPAVPRDEIAPPETPDFQEEILAAAESHRYADHLLEGELIISAETAEREAAAHGWSPRAELLLYVVHGLLHLCGYDDLTDEARPVMRSRERDLLASWGFCPTGLEM